MRRKDLRAFRILEEFASNRAASQRALARKLKVSLGLMNADLKELEGQGLFTVDHIAGSRNRYTLTPAGIAEKTRLSREYIKHSLYYYSLARKRIITLLSDLEDDGADSVGFCGIGFLAEIAYICLRQTHLNLSAVIEDQSRYDLYFNAPVIPMTAVAKYRFDSVLVTVVESAETLVKDLNRNGLPKKKVQLIWK